MLFLKAILQVLLRFIGIRPEDPNAPKGRPLTRKELALLNNKKLHIIMEAQRAAMANAVNAQAQAQAIQIGTSSGSPAPSSSKYDNLAADDHQESVIGKKRKREEGWQQRTGRVRTVRRRKRRRKELSRSLW